MGLLKEPRESKEGLADTRGSRFPILNRIRWKRSSGKSKMQKAFEAGMKKGMRDVWRGIKKGAKDVWEQD